MKVLWGLFLLFTLPGISDLYANPDSQIVAANVSDQNVLQNKAKADIKPQKPEALPIIYLDFFLTTTCPHCRKAEAFFSEMEKHLPWLVVRRFYIDKDKASLLAFNKALQKEGSQNFSVPAFLFCKSHWIGFSTAEASGKTLLNALNYCRRQIIKEGELTAGTVNVLRKWSMASQFRLDPSITASPVKFISLAAITEAFTPCSLFLFAAFMAFLWLYTASKRQQLFAGLTFIFSLGFIHFISDAFFARFYYLIPGLRYPIAVMGVVMLIFISRYIRKTILQGIPARLLFGILVIPLTVFSVFAYQQACMMNVGLIFQHWLLRQDISGLAIFIFQLFYHLIYILPFLILLLLYVLFSHKPRIMLYHRALNITGALLIAFIGATLMVYPTLLANFLISLVVLVFAMLVGWLIARVYG